VKHFKSAWFPQADRAQHILALIFEDAPREVAFVDVTNKQSPRWATLKLSFPEDKEAIGDMVFVGNYLALLFPDARVVRVYNISQCNLDHADSCQELYHIDGKTLDRKYYYIAFEPIQFVESKFHPNILFIRGIHDVSIV
jgi:hypothetical protein